MNAGKLKTVVFILVFLLALALVVHWALELDAKRHPVEEPAEEPQTTAALTPAFETPAPTDPPVQQPTVPTPPPQTRPANTPAPTQKPAPTPTPTMAPAPTPAPTATMAPAPTPAPTATPTPAGQDLGSGSFRSQTNTGLELLCSWSAVSVDGNKAEVTLRIGMESSTVYLNEWADCIHLRVGDQTGTMKQPAITYEGGKTTTEFGSRTFTVDLSKGSSFAVAVEWHYNGSYGGHAIDILECGGTITLG